MIELMVVILIVAILAAVLTPMMTGRIQAAKWSEGTAGAATIVSALRAYAAEHEGDMSGAGTLSGSGGFVNIGVSNADLSGKYFSAGSYVATYAHTGTNTVITIVVTAPSGFTPATKTLTITIPDAGGLATSVWTQT